MKKLFYPVFCLLLCSFLLPQQMDAQYRKRGKRAKHRFNAGVVVGMNVTQMDGDLYTGFDKIGLRAGAKGSMYLNQKMDLVFELLYSQKGSRFENLPIGSVRETKGRAIKLQYMEVPVLLNMKFKDTEEKGYSLEVGFSYGRLIDYEVEEKIIPGQVSYTAMTDDFNSNEFNAIAGLNYNFSRHFALGVQANVQLNKLYVNPNFDTEPEGSYQYVIDPDRQVPFLRNYLFTVQAIYTIF